MSNGIYCVTTRFITGNTCTGTAATTGVDLGTMFVPRSYFTKSGELWTWGSNASGELGINNGLASANASSPVQIFSCGSNWKTINARSDAIGVYGGAFSAIKTDGTLWTWGSNDCSILGTNCSVVAANASSPVQVATGGTTWKSSVSNSGAAIALKTDGTLWGWGGNGGCLGRLLNCASLARCPIQIHPNNNWAFATIGGATGGTVAGIKTDGTLWLWGRNSCGNLGNDTIDITVCSPIQTISGGTNWKSVNFGGFHTTAVKSDGTLWTWGHGQAGRLGDGTTISRSSPVQTISCGTNWRTVSGGRFGTAAIKTDGTLWTWGSSIHTFGTSRSSPIQVISGGTNWLKVCIHNTTAAIKTDGTLWVWGCLNGHGQLGTNSTTAIFNSPVQTVVGGTNWRDVSVGCYSIGAIKSVTYNTNFGRLWAWGSNSQGVLGNNSTLNVSSPIQTIGGATTWRSISAGQFTSLGIKIDGTLWTWGFGSNGQLGNNALTNQSSPVQTIAGGTNWKQASIGFGGALGVKTDGTLWIWGYGGYGAMGDNTDFTKSSPIQTIAGGNSWHCGIAGRFNNAAIKTDGTLWVWGRGIVGMLGNNSTASVSSPVQTIAGGTNWKHASIAAANFMAAIKTDGTLWTWGCGAGGLLGNNTTIDASSPVQIIGGGTNWQCIAAGYYGGSAIKTDGTLWNWGCGLFGSMGQNVGSGNRSSPVQTIAGGTNWNSVSVGRLTASATKTDGTLWSWGCNTDGQLGNNSTLHFSSPVQTIAGGSNWRIAVRGGLNGWGIREY